MRPPKFKRCPFCGGEPKVRQTSRGELWYMQCQVCGAMTRETITASECIELWRRRYGPDKPESGD